MTDQFKTENMYVMYFSINLKLKYKIREMFLVLPSAIINIQ